MSVQNLLHRMRFRSTLPLETGSVGLLGCDFANTNADTKKTQPDKFAEPVSMGNVPRNLILTSKQQSSLKPNTVLESGGTASLL